MSRFKRLFTVLKHVSMLETFLIVKSKPFEIPYETDWSEIYPQRNTQGAFSWFYSRFNLYNKHFPVRKVKLCYNNRKPWLTDSFKQSIRTKNKLYMRYVNAKSAHNESCYKRYRNKLNHLLKIAEKTHVAEKLESNKANLEKTWSILKGIINKRNNAKIQEKFKLSDGSMTSDKQMISERFNDFSWILETYFQGVSQ